MDVSPSHLCAIVPFFRHRTRSIHAYSNAPFIELLVNGKSQGKQAVRAMVTGPGSYAEWIAVPWVTGTLTAIAQDKSGTALTKDERHTNGKATKLALTIDAPSAATGTGTAVLLDGHDAALLRAAVVDADGRVMTQASDNITFKVVSGPGVVQGTGNGDPHSHEPNNAPWHTAYHGLVRGVIRVTSTAARSDYEAGMLASIDVHGPMSGTRTGAMVDSAPIVVEASAPGLAPVQISIMTSTDTTTDGVLAVAEAGAGKPVNFFG